MYQVLLQWIPTISRFSSDVNNDDSKLHQHFPNTGKNKTDVHKWRFTIWLVHHSLVMAGLQWSILLSSLLADPIWSCFLCNALHRRWHHVTTACKHKLSCSMPAWIMLPTQACKAWNNHPVNLRLGITVVKFNVSSLPKDLFKHIFIYVCIYVCYKIVNLTVTYMHYSGI